MIPPLKVPYLRSTDLDRAVAALLRGYASWQNKPVTPPVNVDEIVEGYLGLVLEIDDLKTRLGLDDVLGATWFKDKRICIDASLVGREGRFTFTVGHEIGHWQLHRPHFDLGDLIAPLFPGGSGSLPTMVCRSKDGKAPAEWQADQFAARLLMPEAAVRAVVRALCQDRVPAWEGFDQHRKAGTLAPELRAFADQVREEGCFSNVSNEAIC